MKHNFRELNIWKDSINLVKRIYLITSELPSSEKFNLTSQIQRCAVSIPSNIAEGSGRTSNKEFRHFLNISISSSYELETQLIIISDLYQIEVQEVVSELHNLQKMIGGFKRLVANPEVK
ncbi:MAG: four helix bundle protein [Crocinitomicaceae bacterium]|jgi:four helix bundle protein